MATQVDTPPAPVQSTVTRRGSAHQRAVEDLVRSSEQVDDPLLHWLLRYPFQRVQDLALALNLTSATAYRRVAHQHQHGLVEHITPASLGTGTCRLFYLSNLGLHVLAAREGVEPAALARTWGADERGLLRLLPRLPALTTLQTSLNSVIAGAPTALGSHDRPVLVRWHWVRDYRQRFVFRERASSFMADAVLALRVSPVRPGAQSGRDTIDKWYILVVLLDVGSGDMRPMSRARRLLDDLLRYRESPERWPAYGSFPTLLVLTSAPQRLSQWQRLAAGAAERGAPRSAPLAGAVACVPPASTEIDVWHLRWQVLATGALRRLADLLIPMPQQAVLPGLLDSIPAPGERSTRWQAGGPVAASMRWQPVIRGDFERRGRVVFRGQIDYSSRGRDDRVAMRLLATVLSHRQWEVLDLLFEHPLLCAEEIAAALEVEADSAERYLSPLQRSGCIAETLIPPHATRFRLSERGLHLVADAHHLPLRSVVLPARGHEGTELQRGVAALLAHADHTAGVYGFFAALHRASQAERAAGRKHCLIWWMTGPACAHRYRYLNRWHNLRPDGAGEYALGAHKIRFWLEWDRGTMSLRDLKVKFAAYAHYVRSREWRTNGNIPLPDLLVVTSDYAQETRLVQALNAVSPLDTALRALRIRITTRDRLGSSGAFAPIWRSWVVEVPNTGERLGGRERLGQLGQAQALFEEPLSGD